MSELMGFLYAIVSIVMWGSYLVPFKKIKSDVSYSQFLMCLGVSITAFTVSILIGTPLNIGIWGIIGGIIWTIGNYLSLLAVKEIGISRAFPLWAINLLVAFAWGVLFFKELTSSMTIILGLIGTVCIFIGCFIIGRIRKSKEKPTIRGVMFALTAGLFFGSGGYPLLISNLGAKQFYFQMSVGILITSFILFLLKVRIPKKPQLLEGLSSGLMWSIANFFALHTFLILGISRGVPITQICALVGALWGIFYFKEFTKRKQVIRIIMSAIIIIIGAFFIGFARPQ